MNGTCYCKQGWKGLTCNENINECSQFPDICGNNSICIDTDGSFKCSCKSGYNKDSGGACLGMFYSNMYKNKFKKCVPRICQEMELKYDLKWSSTGINVIFFNS